MDTLIDQVKMVGLFKVEVVNFCAAMGTLIDQDEDLLDSILADVNSFRWQNEVTVDHCF